MAREMKLAEVKTKEKAAETERHTERHRVMSEIDTKTHDHALVVRCVAFGALGLFCLFLLWLGKLAMIW